MSSTATTDRSWIVWLAWIALGFQAFFAMTHFSPWLRPEYGGFTALLILVVAGGKRWRELARHPLSWLLLAFIVYAVLQAAYAARPLPALSFAKQLSYNAKPLNVAVLAFAIGAWLADHPRRMGWLLGLLVAGFVLAALVCTPWAHFDAIVTGVLRLRLRYAENIVGEYAAMGLLLLSLYALSQRPGRHGSVATARGVILVLAGVLLLACLLYAQSRAAWLAAGLVPLTAFACLRDARHRARRPAIIALGVAIVAVIAALAVGYTLVAHRLAGGGTIAAALAHGELAELPSGSVTMRMRLYVLGWHAWRAHPLMGIGLRNIEPLIAASGIHDGSYVPPHLHNAYLQAIVGLGGIGAALLLVAFATLVRAVWLARRSGGTSGALCWAVLGCLGIVLVANVFDYLSWHNDYMRAPLELLLGCCFAMSLRRRRTRSGTGRQALARAQPRGPAEPACTPGQPASHPDAGSIPTQTSLQCALPRPEAGSLRGVSG